MDPGIKVDHPRPTKLLRPRLPLAAQPEPPGACGRIERLALFACALARESALDVLEGLCEPDRARAREYARRVAAMDSPTRQAKIAIEFGVRRDAAPRLRALMADAAPVLRVEILRLLPPYHRSLFPDLAESLSTPAQPAAPGMLAFAQRLVREATR